MRNKTLSGLYNRFGYSIYHVECIKEVYAAGNHRQDSEQTVDIGDPYCLPLKDIRKFCVKTGKEMAREKGYEWGGASRTSDED